MLLSNRIVRLLVDAAEMHGLKREDVLRPLGSDSVDMLVDGTLMEWGSVAAVFDEVARLVGDDDAKLVQIGRDMAKSRAPDVVRDFASGVLSPRALFRFMDRFMSPAFPHIRMYFRFEGHRRVRMRADIPEPHAASLAFFRIFEGRLVSMTELLGLPPCDVIEQRLSPRSAELLLEMPADRSFFRRGHRLVRSIFSGRDSRSARERQRVALAENVEALQRARDELRLLLDRLPDLVVVHRNGRIVWANEAFVRALECDRLDEVVDTTLVDLVAPAFRTMVLERLVRPREELGSLIELCLLAPSGAEVRVEVAPGQSIVFDGLPSRLLVGRDVTERVRMQQRLIAMDRLASVGLLAAGVAHEVNNPLAYVLNNIELARKIAGVPEEAETSRAVLGVALEGVDRIRAIVRDLLLLSRGADLRGAPIDLRPVIQSTLALAAREIEQRAQLEVDLDCAPEVDASGPRVAQVLLNLVSNALEAMRDLPRERARLRVSTRRREDGRFVLEVADTGPGIPLAEQRRIFEPFFTTKAAADGTGLGLSIAQRLVVDMGGEITVESNEGEGTKFRVVLAAAKP